MVTQKTTETAPAGQNSGTERDKDNAAMHSLASWAATMALYDDPDHMRELRKRAFRWLMARADYGDALGVPTSPAAYRDHAAKVLAKLNEQSTHA